MKMNGKLLATAAALTLSANAVAVDLQWQDNSLTYLNGQGFEVDTDKQQAYTFEHVSGWSFGDVFFFTDYIDFEDPNAFQASDAYYGEFSPRFSIGKLTGVEHKFGPVTDVLIATTYEFGNRANESLLYGLGVDLAVPGFDFLQVNAYYRDPINHDASGYQFTPVWKMSWPVGNSEIIFDGFIDWVVGADNAEDNLHFCPQISYNLGKAIWGDDVTLKVGIEYDYWSNKYGIPSSAPIDVDQSATSLMIKYHF